MSDSGDKKVLVLEQVRSSYHTDLDGDEEVGDTIGVYEVKGVNHKECDHPNRRWSVSQDPDGQGEVVEGTCNICGHEIVVNLRDLELLVRSGENHAEVGDIVKEGFEE